jgi:hypothetical protein
LGFRLEGENEQSSKESQGGEGEGRAGVEALHLLKCLGELGSQVTFIVTLICKGYIRGEKRN